MTEKQWTNAYIVGMYILKDRNINISKIKITPLGILIDYRHDKYGNRGVVINDDTDLEKTFFAIDNDGDDYFEYVKCNKEEFYY